MDIHEIDTLFVYRGCEVVSCRPIQLVRATIESGSDTMPPPPTKRDLSEYQIDFIRIKATHPN